MSDQYYESSHLLHWIISGAIATIFLLAMVYFSFFTEPEESETSKINSIEREQIKAQIEGNRISCEYITDLRMKYAGDSFINALDDSWIKSKLRTYWNTHSCGVEWEWWD